MSINEFQHDVSITYVNLHGKNINLRNEISIEEEVIKVDESMKDSLLANLYATVEFLKNELEEKNYVIRTLLSWQTEENLPYGEKKIETSPNVFLNFTINNSSNNTSIIRSLPADIDIITDENTKRYEEVISMEDNNNELITLDSISTLGDSFTELMVNENLNDQLNDIGNLKHDDYLKCNKSNDVH